MPSFHRSLLWAPAALCALLLLALAACTRARERDEGPAVALPPGFLRLLERGAIPEISEPVFVAAADADIPDDAWVLGVEIGGDARAYDLNTLNHHEIVNDRFGDLPVAVVW